MSSLKNGLTGVLHDFTGLFYPNLCIGCGKILRRNEKQLCLNCLMQLPLTNYHLIDENTIEKRFYGKAEVQCATTFLYFEKEIVTQKLLHAIKYRGQKELGEQMGTLFGLQLKNSRFDKIDAIIPVPLHPNKFKVRGYNQSEWIAKGMALTMMKPLISNVLKRIVENPTQTKKGVFERWENTAGIFESENTELIENKHLLLVDDVLTTGATLEACIIPLQKIKGVKISIAALATVI
ncbi:MAG: ComF family protein [Prevotellaceae bacterium]|jgi:ComF family protein|nr:ComF family protein [Prevotellaceae bacterium]